MIQLSFLKISLKHSCSMPELLHVLINTHNIGVCLHWNLKHSSGVDATVIIWIVSYTMLLWTVKRWLIRLRYMIWKYISFHTNNRFTDALREIPMCDVLSLVIYEAQILPAASVCLMKMRISACTGWPRPFRASNVNAYFYIY